MLISAAVCRTSSSSTDSPPRGLTERQPVPRTYNCRKDTTNIDNRKITLHHDYLIGPHL